MSELTNGLTPKLEEIIEAFQEAQGREKLELLLEFAEGLPPLPDSLKGHRDSMQQVHECMSPVFLTAEVQDGKMQYYFDIPPDAPTVRGYAGVLLEGLNGTTPETVLRVPGDFYQPMGLAGVVSHQRLNGMSAILAYMKRLATAELAKQSDEK